MSKVKHCDKLKDENEASQDELKPDLDEGHQQGEQDKPSVYYLSVSSAPPRQKIPTANKSSSPIGKHSLTKELIESDNETVFPEECQSKSDSSLYSSMEEIEDSFDSVDLLHSSPKSSLGESSDVHSSVLFSYKAKQAKQSPQVYISKSEDSPIILRRLVSAREARSLEHLSEDEIAEFARALTEPIVDNLDLDEEAESEELDIRPKSKEMPSPSKAELLQEQSTLEDVVKVQSSLGKLVIPETCPSPFENIVQKSDDKISRTVSVTPLARGRPDQDNSDLTTESLENLNGILSSVQMPNSSKPLVEEEHSGAKKEQLLSERPVENFKVGPDFESRVNFVQSQEQFFSSVVKHNAQLLVQAEEQSPPLPEIETEDQLLAHQDSLQRRQEAFLEQVNRSVQQSNNTASSRSVQTEALVDQNSEVNIYRILAIVIGLLIVFKFVFQI